MGPFRRGSKLIREQLPMSARIPALAFVVALTAVLTACGGGGGGVVVRPEVPFTSFPELQPNTTVVMSGISRTASGTQTVAVDGSRTIDSASLGAVDTANSTAKLAYDFHLNLVGVSVSTPQSSVSFSAGHGTTIDCTSGVCSGETATASWIAIDATAVGWNYQTFGVWAMDVTPTTYQLGAISAGSATPGSAVPTTSTAIFNGSAHGFMSNAAGTPFFTAASMTANVNWSTQSIVFATSSTQLVNMNTAAPTADTGYNLSGNLTYTAGTNQFSGTVTTANTGVTGLTGTAAGRFYGPNAEEIGGIYGLTGSGRNAMIGGFGGKR